MAEREAAAAAAGEEATLSRAARSVGQLTIPEIPSFPSSSFTTTPARSVGQDQCSLTKVTSPDHSTELDQPLSTMAIAPDRSAGQVQPQQSTMSAPDQSSAQVNTSQTFDLSPTLNTRPVAYSSPKPTVTLKDLAEECLLHIALSFDDLQSLYAFGRTCRAFIRVFQTAQDSIPRSMVEEVIPSEVLNSAIAAMDSADRIDEIPAPPSMSDDYQTARSKKNSRLQFFKQLVSEHHLESCFLRRGFSVRLLKLNQVARNLTFLLFDKTPISLRFPELSWEWGSSSFDLPEERIRVRRALFWYQVLINTYINHDSMQFGEFYAFMMMYWYSWKVHEIFCVRIELYYHLNALEKQIKENFNVCDRTTSDETDSELKSRPAIWNRDYIAPSKLGLVHCPLEHLLETFMTTSLPQGLLRPHLEVSPQAVELATVFKARFFIGLDLEHFDNKGLSIGKRVNPFGRIPVLPRDLSMSPAVSNPTPTPVPASFSQDPAEDAAMNWARVIELREVIKNRTTCVADAEQLIEGIKARLAQPAPTPAPASSSGDPVEDAVQRARVIDLSEMVRAQELGVAEAEQRTEEEKAQLADYVAEYKERMVRARDLC